MSSDKEQVNETWEDLLSSSSNSESELEPPKETSLNNNFSNEKEVSKNTKTDLTVKIKDLSLESKKDPAQTSKNSDSASADNNTDLEDLRSPICCILGHVDTGKTKLLDKIRQTNVQLNEAGGITQQIGATYFPIESIISKTKVIKDKIEENYHLPGLLIIDTPGHESFTNLRSRGSSLCNIAILVVDITQGLEQQTLESIRLLRERKAPFVVALNKIDRMFGWQTIPDNAFVKSISKQNKHVKQEFESKMQNIILQFAEQGLNAILYTKNKNFAKYVSIVPTSAVTGEGIPDLLNLLIYLTQTRMSKKLKYVADEFEATVLEVKVVEGFGTTIDVILVNGVLNEGDRIALCGLNGPIVTNVRAILTPQPLRELRIKSNYIHHKKVKAALGVKIAANNLDKAIAGSRLMVIKHDNDEEQIKNDVMMDLENMFASVDKTGVGVCVQASTLGSLEALLKFLEDMKIPVSGISIGPIHKKDVIRASSIIEKAKEMAVILAFDVKIDKEAQDLATETGVKIFCADVIYHLFDAFTKYTKEISDQKKKEHAPQAVFPCILKIIPGAVFNKRDPIVLGLEIVEGTIRIGTPICVIKTDENNNKEIVLLGNVGSMEHNHKQVELAKKGQYPQGIAVKIEAIASDTPKLFGRHFEENDLLYSRITRRSIDILKESFRNEVTKDEWQLIIRLKKLMDVI